MSAVYTALLQVDALSRCRHVNVIRYRESFVAESSDAGPLLCIVMEYADAGRYQGGYIFYAGGSLAGAGYCRKCRRRPAILLLQLWQRCQVCVKISAQRPPKVAQFNAR